MIAERTSPTPLQWQRYRPRKEHSFPGHQQHRRDQTSEIDAHQDEKSDGEPEHRAG